jgi:hypothetical protein
MEKTKLQFFVHLYLWNCYYKKSQTQRIYYKGDPPNLAFVTDMFLIYWLRASNECHPNHVYLFQIFPRAVAFKNLWIAGGRFTQGQISKIQASLNTSFARVNEQFQIPDGCAWLENAKINCKTISTVYINVWVLEKMPNICIETNNTSVIKSESNKWTDNHLNSKLEKVLGA